MPNQSRQLAAIMFTDIVGYTQLMGEDEQRALNLISQSVAFQKSLVEKYNGVWVKEIGDGVLARFSSALDAVNCGLEIQREARADFEEKFRIGIHLGDINIENNDVFGDGVNVASRIEAVADPGGIYISESVEKAIRGRTEIQTRYLGDLKLKNVSYDVGTYALQGVGLPPPDQKSKEKLSGKISAEIKRRGILRAGLTYIILALLTFVLHNQLESLISLSSWVTIAFFAVLILGFPISLLLAWKFERSPEGFVRTTSKASWRNPLKASERKPLTGYVSILVLLVIISILFLYPQSYNGSSGNSGMQNKRSIAFLPLQNISDEENDYLANGVKTEIATYLRNIPDLKVYAGLDVEQLLKSNLSKKEIGNKLGVTSTLEGSIWKEQKRFKLSLVLTDLETDEILWNESYEKEYDLIMDVVSEVAQDLAGSIQIALEPEAQLHLIEKPTTSPEAYDLNLKAWQERTDAFYSGNRDSMLNISNNLARKALEYDPEYVLVYNLIAANEVDKGNIDTATIVMDEMLRKFPNHSLTYKLKAGLEFYHGDYDPAIKDFAKAIELGSNDPWDYMQLGRLYSFEKKDFEKGIPLMIKGAEMPPIPGTMAILGFVPGVYRKIGDYDKSLYWSNRWYNYSSSCNGIGQLTFNYLFQCQNEKSYQVLDSLCNTSDCSNCEGLYFYVHIYSGNIENAIDLMKKGNIKVNSWFDKFFIAYLKIKAGEIAEGKDILTKLKSQIEVNPRKGTTNIDGTDVLAGIYGALGEKKKAIELLKQWGETGLLTGTLEFMLNNPFYENLLDESEYIALCKRMDKEKAEIRARIKELDQKGKLKL